MSAVLKFSDLGGVPNDSSNVVQQYNSKLLNGTLQTLQSGETLLIEGTYWMMGGIVGEDLAHVTLQLDGQIHFSTDLSNWPRDSYTNYVLPCINLSGANNVTLTSSKVGGGVLNGNGWAWWGFLAMGYLVHTENRPRLLYMYGGQNVILENWILEDPAYWATYFPRSYNLEIRYTGVSARRTRFNAHTLLDMTAFNTDGLDVSGENVWIHDCNIWCQDDAVAVKDGSKNMLFERLNVSGVGLTIGSIGKSDVSNITFRDCNLYKPWKGIHLKFRNAEDEESYRDNGIIEEVLFENIVIYSPRHWPIWIGPAQQSDTRRLCYANPCSICWPALSSCDGQKLGIYSNITLRNISIYNPETSAGVLIGHDSVPMTNVTFDGVRVQLCSGMLTADPVAMFQLLPSENSSDIYSKNFWIMCILVILIFFIKLPRPSSTSSTPSKDTHMMTKGTMNAILLLTVLLSFAIVSLLYISYYKIETGKVDSYYRCNSVQGIATGDTWPVPSCFEDQTTVNKENGFGTCSEYGVTPPLVNMTKGVWIASVVLFGLFYCHKFRRFQHDNEDSSTALTEENPYMELDFVERMRTAELLSLEKEYICSEDRRSM